MSFSKDFIIGISLDFSIGISIGFSSTLNLEKRGELLSYWARKGVTRL